MPALTLLGSHLILTPLLTSHATALVKASADGNLWQSKWTNVPDATNVADYIQVALDQQAQGAALPFTMVVKDTGDIVGTTRVFKVDRPNRAAEIGHTWIAQSWQRSFVNTESKYLLLRYAFEEMNLLRVQLYTDEQNARSREAILRLGAKEEGTLRKERIMAGGGVRNTVVYSILDNEWPDVRSVLERKLSPNGSGPGYHVLRA